MQQQLRGSTVESDLGYARIAPATRRKISVGSKLGRSRFAAAASALTVDWLALRFYIYAYADFAARRLSHSCVPVLHGAVAWWPLRASRQSVQNVGQMVAIAYVCIRCAKLSLAL